MDQQSAQEQRYRKMTETPIPRLVSTLAVPTIISMLVSSIYNMADTYFVSQLSTSASAAVGVVFSLQALIQAVGFMLGMGAGAYISRLLGARNREEAEAVAATATLTAVACGLLMAVVGLSFSEEMVALLGASPGVMPYAKEYARYILIGAPYMMASFVLNNILRSQGNAAYSMVGLGLGSILNIVLDPLLIFGLNMGIAGAAVATIASQLVSFILLLYFCNRKGSVVKIIPRKFTFRWSVYWEILRIGMPSFYRQGLSSLATVSMNWSARPYGDAALAAMSIVARVYMFTISALLGFGQGFQPVCGYNYGAKKYDRVRKAFWFCVRVGFVGLLILAVIGIVFAEQILTVFRREDADVIRIGAQALRYLCTVLPLMSFVILSNMLFQSMGRGIKASFMALCQQGIFYIPLLLLLPLVLQLQGIQIAQATANLMSFIVCIPLTVGEMKRLKNMEALNVEQNEREATAADGE